jgi:NAD(P)-dependent dehydrogenase (short-subunit alcohol dehydrogenase family)
MPNITTVRETNALLTPMTVPKTAVFVGGTAGIGKLTLTALAQLGFSLKAYVIGQKGSEASFKTFAEELRSKNAEAAIIWTECEVSLLSEAKRICDHIKTLESSIDLLFLSTGYAPMGGRNSTSFGPLSSTSTNTSRTQPRV